MNLATDGLEGRLPGEKTYWEMGDGTGEESYYELAFTQSA